MNRKTKTDDEGFTVTTDGHKRGDDNFRGGRGQRGGYRGNRGDRGGYRGRGDRGNRGGYRGRGDRGGRGGRGRGEDEQPIERS